MKHSIPLKHVDYEVPFPDTCANRMGNRGGDSFETHLMPLKVSIDFEKNNLYLEGRGLFEKDPFQKPEPIVPIPDNERIRVKAIISSGFSINLSEFTKDEVVFSMDGSLDDGKTINNCSGLIVFGKTINRDGSESGEYHLTVHLYDDYNQDREIKLRLTMYPLLPNAAFN